MSSPAVLHASNGHTHPVDIKATAVVSPELSARLALGGVVATAGSPFLRGPKPNLSLWVTKGHEIYLEEVPYPSCSPDTWFVLRAKLAIPPLLAYTIHASVSCMFGPRVSVVARSTSGSTVVLETAAFRTT